MVLVQPESPAYSPTHGVKRLRANSFISADLKLKETSCSLTVQEPGNVQPVPIEFKWPPPPTNGPIESKAATDQFEYRLEARTFWLDKRSVFFGRISRTPKGRPCLLGEDADTFVAVSAKPGDPGPPPL